jgi:hypothetical protein
LWQIGDAPEATQSSPIDSLTGRLNQLAGPQKIEGFSSSNRTTLLPLGLIFAPPHNISAADGKGAKNARLRPGRHRLRHARFVQGGGARLQQPGGSFADTRSATNLRLLALRQHQTSAANVHTNPGRALL